MYNFEQPGLVTKTDKNKDFHEKSNREVDKFILDKINPVIIAIKNSDFNLNNPIVDKKIERLSEEVLGKFFSSNEASDYIFKDNLEKRILKISLEEVADEFGGSLGFYENLEDSYLDILSHEALLIIEDNPNFIESCEASIYIKNLCDKLNNKNILDNNKKGVLFNKIKKLATEKEFESVT